MANITSTSITANTQTPNGLYVGAKRLYNDFLDGKRPDYHHDINQDPNMQQLNVLAERYKQSLSIDDKKKLLNHESLMLYDEVMHPELTLARNYDIIKHFYGPKTLKANLKNIIMSFNISGLQRSEMLENPFKSKGSPEKIKILYGAKASVNENATFGSEIHSAIDGLLAKFGVGCAQNDEIKDTNLLLINDLRKNSNNEKELKSLLLYADKDSYKETTEIVNGILKNKKVSPEIKRLAVWGAGKFRSEEGFKTIKQIALNTNEKDIRLREFAIQSTALYLKQKPDEVKSIMSTIEKDGSIFAPLGRIINDKVNGRYHGQKDREFKYANLSEAETRILKATRNGCMIKDAPINTRKQNYIDRDFLLYRQNLPQTTSQKFLVTNDTCTKYFSQYTGKRLFYSSLDLNCGVFGDAFTGLGGDDCTININRVGTHYGYSSLAHELGHSSEKQLSEIGERQANQLYKNSMRNGRVLDSYAAFNSSENYAQGCEAMASIYKPHNILIDQRYSNFNHTRYELMAKDHKLYNFIKRALNLLK